MKTDLGIAKLAVEEQCEMMPTGHGNDADWSRKLYAGLDSFCWSVRQDYSADGRLFLFFILFIYFGINAQIHGHLKQHVIYIKWINTYEIKNHDMHINTKDDTKKSINCYVSIVVLVIDGIT